MSTKNPADGVLVLDRIPQLHPIRIPVHELLELHERTETHLEAFVARHCEQFPQIAGRNTWNR